jgi:hypothetical protein
VLAHLGEFAEGMPPHVSGETWRRLTALEDLLRREMEQLAPPAASPPRPAFLRLVVDNTVLL